MKQNINLAQFFNTLAYELDTKIDAINCGGCCVYASIVAEKLEAAGIKYEIWVSNWGGQSIQDMRKNCELSAVDWQQNGFGFSHVLLKVKLGRGWWLWDSKGLTKPIKYDGHAYEDTCGAVLRGKLSLEEAQIFAAEERAWNPTFDRKQIPTIRRIVNKHFKSNGLVA